MHMLNNRAKTNSLPSERHGSGRLVGLERLPLESAAGGPGSIGSAQRALEAARAAHLQWRSPWWAWQLLSLGLATLMAPTFLITCLLLMVDAHSDHPFFWGALPGIVALANAVAIVCSNQRHHRTPFAGRAPLARQHLAMSLGVGCGLFLLVGWSTGFLGDFMPPVLGSLHAFGPLATLMGSAALALAFGLLSFPHGGMLHAWLAFEEPA
jgi:hypothetical protein